MGMNNGTGSPILEVTPQVIVYGPDGQQYATPAAARAAGVDNYTMQQPQTGIGGATPMPEVGGGGGKGGIGNPILGPGFGNRPGIGNPALFNNYGYGRPEIGMQVMPGMGMQAPQGGIVDPSYLAQLEILNQPQIAAAPGQMLGSGLINAVMGGGGGNLTIPDYRPQAQQFRQDLVDLYNATSGGDGGQVAFNPNQDFGYFSGVTPSVDYSIPVSDALVQTVGPDGSLSSNVTVSPVQDYGPVVGTPLGPVGGGGGGGGDSYGGGGGGFSDFGGGFSVGDAMSGGTGYGGGGFSDSGGGFSVGDVMGGGDGYGGGGSSSGDSGGGKIVCTAMNEAYGFGSFRNRIWLAYAAKHLTKAHEAGYHAMFLPLVDVAYKQKSWYSKPLRKALENIARHRSADLRAEMRGTKRDTLGRAYRLILEPLCYAVGKLKGY